MTTDFDTLLGGEDAAADRRNRWKRVSRGPLHEVLTRALPDLKSTVAGEDICDLTKLAQALEMSKQGVYKWFMPGRKNQIPAEKVERIVAMSQNQTMGGPDFQPVTRNDFWDFLPPR